VSDTLTLVDGLYGRIGRLQAENEHLQALVEGLTDEINTLRARLQQSERSCHTLTQIAAMGLLGKPEISATLPDAEGAASALIVLEGLLLQASHRAAHPRPVGMWPDNLNLRDPH
jgi:hypothetical protein